MKEQDEMVYSTEAPNFLPREGLIEFIETTTTTKRWIYHRSVIKLVPRKQRRGEVKHTHFGDKGL